MKEREPVKVEMVNSRLHPTSSLVSLVYSVYLVYLVHLVLNQRV